MYVNSGPVGAGKKTPVDLAENNVLSFLGSDNGLCGLHGCSLN